MYNMGTAKKRKEEQSVMKYEEKNMQQAEKENYTKNKNSELRHDAGQGEVPSWRWYWGSSGDDAGGACLRTLLSTSGGACGGPGGGAAGEHTLRGPPPHPEHHRPSRVPRQPDPPGGYTAYPSPIGAGDEASCATWTRKTKKMPMTKCSWFSCGTSPANEPSSRVCAGCGAGYRPCHNRVAGT